MLLDIGMEYPIRAMWAAKHTLEVGMEDDSGFGEYDEATDTYYCPEGWYEWNEHEETHWAVDETPTAWCELPPNGGASHGQAPAQAAPAAVAGPSEAVAYLDIGAGGYLDLGTDLSDEALSRLPKGRHALVIAGTYGIDGYTPTPPAQAAESVTAPASGTNWQDISTAPKDGTLFVAVGQNYGLDSEKQHTCIAQWLAGCWVEVSDWNGASKLKYLTHWMPLPPLPGSAARAPADSVLEDAARYRWLRATTNYVTSNGERIDVRNSPEKWDAAIDAARAARKQGGA